MSVILRLLILNYRLFQDENGSSYTGIGIITLAFIGTIVNLAGIVILVKKPNPSMFHTLLRVNVLSCTKRFYYLLSILYLRRLTSYKRFTIMIDISDTYYIWHSRGVWLHYDLGNTELRVVGMVRAFCLSHFRANTYANYPNIHDDICLLHHFNEFWTVYKDW